jgi:hypothetical protein
MAFSFGVELLNMVMMKRSKKIVELHEPVLETKTEDYGDSAH